MSGSTSSPAGDADAVHLGELAVADASEPSVDAASDAAADAAPPRRRRRWIVGVLVTVLVVTTLAVVGWFVAEAVLRPIAADQIRSVVVDALGTTPDQVDVEVGGGAIVPQLLAGSLDLVEIELDSMTVGAVSGAATLRAEGVPITEGGAIERVVATVLLPPSSIAELAATATGLPTDAITVGDTTVSLSSEFNAFITTLTVGVELAVSARDGAIALDPVGVTLGDAAITADELRGIPIIGAAASSLLQTQVICVADTLPAALSLTDLRIADGTTTVTLRGTAVPTEQGALSVTGTC